MAHQLAAGRKILLLSDLPPCLNYTGGVALHPLCAAFRRNQFVNVVVRHPALTDAVTDPKLGLKTFYISKPKESLGREYGRKVSKVLGRLLDLRNEFFYIPRITREVANICREENITDIWCVLQGQTMVRLCNQIRKKTGLPIYTQVWDPIGWWLRSLRIDRRSTKKILADFAEAISRSRATACASIPMARLYADRYHVPTRTVILGLPASLLAEKIATEADSSASFKIGLSGQVYAVDEFTNLVHALDDRQWIVGGRRVEVHYFGSGFGLTPPKNFVNHGWLAPSELIPRLSEMDLLYCPYWFDPQYEEEARNSFPSKFVTYLAAGKPTLFHGPRYSSAAEFIESQNCAYQCNETGVGAIGQALDQIIKTGLADTIAANARSSFLEFFTEDRMRADFFSLLEVGYKPAT